MTQTIPSPPTKPPHRLRRMVLRLVRIFVIVYLVMCGVLYFAQDWMAFPGWWEQGKPSTKIWYGGDVQTVRFATATGIPIVGVYGAARRADGAEYSPADHRPTILYFYGNAGSVAYSQGEFDHFRLSGCNVLIPDLAGYGESGGKPSESNFYATADAAWDWLQNKPGVDGKKIIVVGWSMGAGVAVDLAYRKPVIGLATFNGYTSLGEMGRRLLPWFPTGLLAKYRFDNLTKIASIHCPIFVCNGAYDTLVPPEMSSRLAAKAGGRVTRLVVETADHNSIFSAEPTRVWTHFDAWIASLFRYSGRGTG